MAIDIKGLNYADMGITGKNQLGSNKQVKNANKTDLTDGLSQKECEKIDTNSDGVITEKEYLAACKKQGIKNSVAENHWQTLTLFTKATAKADNTGNQTITQTAKGKTLTTVLDNNSDVISKNVTNKNGSQTITEYASDGAVTKTEKDKAGKITKETVTQNDGSQTITSYASNGTVTQTEKDTAGKTTKVTVTNKDKSGNITKVTITNQDKSKTITEYASNGTVTVTEKNTASKTTGVTVTKNDGSQTITSYASNGTVTKTDKDSTGNITKVTVTNKSKSQTITDYASDGIVTVTEKDKAGKITKKTVTQNDGSQIITSYASNGTVTQTEKDKAGKTTKVTVTNKSKSQTITEYASDGAVTQTEKDKAGKITKETVTQNDGSQTITSYASNGTVTQTEKDTAGKTTKVTVTNKDKSGNVTKVTVTKKDGSKTITSYKDNEIISINKYDANGKKIIVNSKLDEQYTQGQTGDCWFISGIRSLYSTPEGKKLIEKAINPNADGSVTVTFKGADKSYTIKKKEIKEHDTDFDRSDAYSNGDNDMLVLELAAEKLRKELGIKDDLEGGHFKEVFGYFTNMPVIINTSEYVSGGFTYNDNTLIKILNEKVNNKNLAIGLCMGGFFSNSAKLIDGTEYTYNIKGGGHAFAVTEVKRSYFEGTDTIDKDNSTVTFIDPNKPDIKNVISWNEFVKLAPWRIDTVDLNPTSNNSEPAKITFDDAIEIKKQSESNFGYVFDLFSKEALGGRTLSPEVKKQLFEAIGNSYKRRDMLSLDDRFLGQFGENADDVKKVLEQYDKNYIFCSSFAEKIISYTLLCAAGFEEKDINTELIDETVNLIHNFDTKNIEEIAVSMKFLSNPLISDKLNYNDIVQLLKAFDTDSNNTFGVLKNGYVEYEDYQQLVQETMREMIKALG